jgi:hypothetical protein
VAGGPVPTLPIGGEFETVLGPFDVLNLESDDFNGDFTGSTISADGPVVVFSGSEASDAPFFSSLSERYCCADHLEDSPIRSARPQDVVATVSANRTQAVCPAPRSANPSRPIFPRDRRRNLRACARRWLSMPRSC